jgi:hypothetical protein
VRASATGEPFARYRRSGTRREGSAAAPLLPKNAATSPSSTSATGGSARTIFSAPFRRKSGFVPAGRVMEAVTSRKLVAGARETSRS